jgi:Mor family transcriptional regulator
MTRPRLPLPEEHLPKSVAELVRVVGLAAALAIVEERGGTRLYVPTEATPEHWLAALIGMEAFAALVDYAAGDELDIARCVAALRAAQELQIALDAEAGMSQSQLALKHRYTERGIRKVLRRVAVRVDARQQALF